MSLGRHEPPNPGPGWRNFGPIRRSSPIPFATSWTSAPTASESTAISLMNEIFAARNAFAAYLISSAERTPVTTIGVSIR